MGYQGRLNDDHVVPATKFVRDFANYARMAIDEPVHIFKHGRPTLSLVATNQLKGLLQPEDSSGSQRWLAAKLDIVLDHVRTLIVLVDEQFEVLRVNAAARTAFQLSDGNLRGISVQDLFHDPRQEFLVRAMQRVRDMGVAEHIEFDSFDPPVRSFQAYIRAFPGGFAMFAEDITHMVALRNADLIADAYAGLLEITPGIAFGTLDARGAISSASHSLSELVETHEHRLVGVRLTALCEIGFRGEVGDRVEALLSDVEPFSISLNLIGQSKSIPVVLSAYPHQGHGRRPGAIFLIRSTY
jgi:hypothetical protein